MPDVIKPRSIETKPIETGTAMNPLNDTRRKILKVPFADLMALMRGELVGKLGPEDLLHTVYMDYRDGCMSVVIISPSYEPVPIGTRIPFSLAPFEPCERSKSREASS